jgi:hypothetical protein
LDESVSRFLSGLKIVVEVETARDDRQELTSAFLQEISVVGNQKEGSLVLVASGDQRVDGLEVQKVGRFIEDKKMRAFKGEFSEDHTRSLRVRKALDSGISDSTDDSGLSQMLAELADVIFGEGFLHEGHGSSFHIKLGGRVLAEVGELEVGVVGNSSGGGLQLVGQKLQESGFTSTIGSHNTDSSAQKDVEGDGLLEDVVAGGEIVREGHILKVDEGDLVLRSSGIDTFRDGESDGRGEGELGLQSDQFLVIVISPSLLVQALTADLGAGVGVLVLLAELLDLFVLLLRFDFAFLFELIESAEIIFDLELVDHQDAGTNVLKQLTIVSNEQEGASVTPKSVFEPKD